MEKEVEAQVAEAPEIQEHVGEIKEFNWIKSTDESLNEETYVYDIKGSKGSGSLTVAQVTEDDGSETVTAATLTPKKGKKVEVTLD